MFRPLWFSKLLGLKSRSVRRRQAAQQRRYTRLQLEGLEERITPTTNVINHDVASAADLQNYIQNTVNTDPSSTDQYVIHLTGTGASAYQLTQMIDINSVSSVKIEGNGQTITPKAGLRAFSVESTAEFDNLTISGGKMTATGVGIGIGGAAIKDVGGNVKLSNVNVTHNTVYAAAGGTAVEGGGIYVSGTGSLTITNSHIDNNSVLGVESNGTQVPAAYAQGGGIYVNGTGTINISGSTLSDNLAQGGNGGDVSVSTADPNITQSRAAGGAMKVVAAANVLLTNATIDSNRVLGGSGITGSTSGTNNVGEADGGGLEVFSNLQMVGSEVSKNQAIGGGGAVSGSGGYAFGGGLVVGHSSVATVLNSSFNNNLAKGGNSANGRGGEALGGGIDDFIATLKLLNSTVGDNTAQGGDGTVNNGSAVGGGVSFSSGGTIPQMFNDTIVFNKALGGNGSGAAGLVAGGGIYQQSASSDAITMVNSLVQGNATNGVDRDASATFAGGSSNNIFSDSTGIGGTVPGSLNTTIQVASSAQSVNGSPLVYALLPNATAAINGGTTATPPSVVSAIAFAEGFSDPTQAVDEVGKPRTRNSGLFIDVGAVQFNQAVTGVNFTNSPSALSVSFGAAATPSFTTTLTDQNGQPITRGQVVATVDGGGSATVLLDGAHNTIVIPSLTLPLGLPAGSYSIQLEYTNPSIPGLVGDGQEPLTVVPASASATVALNDPASITFNTAAQSVNVSATVGSSVTVNEGTVTFELFDSGNHLVATANGNVGGGAASAALTLSAGTPAGSYTLKATYSDPSGNFVSNGPATTTLIINAATVTVALNSVPPITASTTDQSVNVLATVGSNGTVNEGTVTFELLNSSNNVVSSVQANVRGGTTGVVSLTVPGGTPIGSYHIQATYSDLAGNFVAAGPATTTLAISSASATVALSGVTPITANMANQLLSVSATVSSDATVNEGTVTFVLLNGSNVQVGNSVQANVTGGTTGAASLTVPGGTAAGNYHIQATYNDPTNTFAAAGPVTTPLTIKVAATVVTVGVIPPITASTANQTVNVSAAVTSETFPTNNGGMIPLVLVLSYVNEGTVTFVLLNGNGVQIGGSVTAIVNNGTASATLTVPGGLPAGVYAVQATYTDSRGVFDSGSGNQVLLVNSPPPLTTPAVSTPTPAPTPSLFNAAFTLFIDAIELVLSQNSFGPRFGLSSQSDILDSINANLPFAGVLGFPALSAGMNAANQALGISGQ